MAVLAGASNFLALLGAAAPESNAVAISNLLMALFAVRIIQGIFMHMHDGSVQSMRCTIFLHSRARGGGGEGHGMLGMCEGGCLGRRTWELRLQFEGL